LQVDLQEQSITNLRENLPETDQTCTVHQQQLTNRLEKYNNCTASEEKKQSESSDDFAKHDESQQEDAQSNELHTRDDNQRPPMETIDCRLRTANSSQQQLQQPPTKEEQSPPPPLLSMQLPVSDLSTAQARFTRRRQQRMDPSLVVSCSEPLDSLPS
jgi:hypothetical protein